MADNGNTKVFGMPAETGRWAFVLAGMIMNLCLGTVYAWSVFRKPLQELFSTPEVKITATQTLWPFMLFLAVFTVLMPISGRLLQRGIKPALLSVIGSLIVAAGWILSRYATDINFLYLSYGLIAGAGVGIVYGIPIAVATRWFPDIKGIAVGITVLGFGVSALVTAPMAVALIKSDGILLTFQYLGFFFLVVLVLLSLLLRFPPAGWKPVGWQPAVGSSSTVDYTTSEVLKTSSGWGLWLCFIIGSLSGLMAIGISSPVGQEIIKLDAPTAAFLVSFFAIFNGGGRPVFGWLTDALGPGKAAALSFALILLASVLMILFAGEGKLILFAFCFACLWAALGSWLAIAPVATATFFGIKNSAANYGVIFSAYGIGAIAAGLIAGQAKDVFGSYIYAFYVTAGLALLGIIIALTLMRPPKVASDEALLGSRLDRKTA
ncbi:MAG TPA: OFA family MFS transporter [Candidatus Competibacteraceae bacterium]|nr:OFA family MFS transporter [Candidatus Competibacteraceae bacterium]